MASSLFFYRNAKMSWISPGLAHCLKNFFLAQANVNVPCGCGAALTTPPQYVILLDGAARGYACKCLRQYDKHTRTLATTQAIDDWACLIEEAQKDVDSLDSMSRKFIDSSLLMDIMLERTNKIAVIDRKMRCGFYLKDYAHMWGECDNIEKIHPQYLIIIGDHERRFGFVWIHQFSKWCPEIAANLASWFASDEEIRKKIPEITSLCREMVLEIAPVHKMFNSAIAIATDKSYDESCPQEIATAGILVHVDIYDRVPNSVERKLVRHYDFSKKAGRCLSLGNSSRSNDA